MAGPRRRGRPGDHRGSALAPDRHVYGVHPVIAACSAQRRAVTRIRGTERALARIGKDLPRTGNLEVVRDDAAGLDALTGGAAHQGVVAEVGPYPYLPEDVLPEPSEARRMVVALDEVSDPHNLGAVARTCEAVGARLLVPERRSAQVTAAASAASAGALERIEVVRCRNLHDALAACKDAGYWVYGLDADATTPHSASDLRGDLVLVLGSEGRGLRPRVESACDALLAIPMRGHAGSLNVSVACGVVAFEADRQQRQGEDA